MLTGRLVHGRLCGAKVCETRVVVVDTFLATPDVERKRDQLGLDAAQLGVEVEAEISFTWLSSRSSEGCSESFHKGTSKRIREQGRPKIPFENTQIN